MSSKQKLFTDNWKFKKFSLGLSYEEMKKEIDFKSVDIPHDWLIFDSNNLYENSVGFYRKTFNLCPQKGHTYMVRFEGVYMNCRVYLNGQDIFEWKYGYSTFDVDLTDHLVCGDNVIEVVVKYEAPNSRWYSGAGIYRKVYFYDKDESFFVPDGVYVSTQRIEGNDFNLLIDSEVKSNAEHELKLINTLIDANGKIVVSKESKLSVCEGETIVNNEKLKIKNVKLWNTKTPYLYILKTYIYKEDELLDETTTNVGFRSIRFDSEKGFFLNEEHIKIQGVCQHHDLGSLGAAVNKVALKRQLTKLKKMGINSIRTSHNMPCVELMELADEMGILINSEAFDMWELPKTTYDYGNFFPTWYEKDVRSWIRRDRNHPSLIIWSIGNEIYDTHAGNGYKWTILLGEAVRKHDYCHNAYIGNGSNYMEWEGAQNCATKLELVGYNYGERLYDDHHKKHPEWVIFGSETGSTVQSRGIYHFPFEQRTLTHEDSQCSSLGNCTTNWGAKSVDFVVSAHRDRDFAFGQYIWTGWDYIGEPTPYFTKNSFFGQIDTAGFEKDTYYHYQAEWTNYKENPMVHLLPYWSFNEGQIIDVVAYTNGVFAELFLNGKSLGMKEIDHNSEELQARWKVPFEEGEILVKAYDEEKKVIATDSHHSFCDPIKIIANADRQSLLANGEDLAFVEISVVDKSGYPVENARNRIHVSVSGHGRLLGLDNGDSTDYEQYKGTNRKLFSGKLLAIIATTKEAGEIKINLESMELEGCDLVLFSEAVESDSAICCSDKNYENEYKEDIPVRQIVLTNNESNKLDKEHVSAVVEYKLLPENATYNDITFKAMTKDGIEANFATVTVSENKATVNALGDGMFKLTAFCKNGQSDHSEVVSELEFEITGLGKAVFDPYKMVPGIELSKCSHEATLSFNGGAFIPASGEGYVTFDNLDFGEIGSDEISIPIFSFANEMPVEIFEGDVNGESLGKFTYQATSIYNTYQANTFKLNRYVKGLTSITIWFDTTSRFSLEGISFTYKEKAYEKINAINYSRIIGDSFEVTDKAIEKIGNNVNIEYDNMNFSTNGLSGITVCGRSRNEKTSMHIMFMDGEISKTQMVEFSYSKEYEEKFFELSDERTSKKAAFMFLPGSNFDLMWFRFEKKE